MPDHELVFRALLFLPLLLITYQVVLLSRILRSRSWSVLTLGFVVFTINLAIQLFILLPLTFRLILSIVGYICVAAGFYLLRRDLVRFIHYIDRGEA